MLREAQNLGPDQQRVVDAIEGHSAELAQMIERILSVSHLGGDDSPLEPGDFRLDRLLAELEAAFGSRCERKGLGWTIDADVADGWVHGDSKKLQQTLVHLLDNAVKFTDSGGVSLTVSGDADHFRFEVRDSGSGIEPALREDVLAAFHQGDAAIGPGGVGLGLTIAHRHVEQMGGALQIEAGEQGGTAVSFDLPLPPAAGTPTARHDEAPAVGSDTAAEATEAPRIRLPAELQQGLQEALSTHSMSDLRKAIDEVEVLDAEGRRLASQLRDLSQRFDLAAIAALLKEVAND
jgi:K+-sensing histidine kinase KdpD